MQSQPSNDQDQQNVPQQESNERSGLIPGRRPSHQRHSWLERRLKLRGKLYMYTGPDHPQIHDLLDILEERQEKQLSIRCLEWFRQKWLRVLEWFKQKCTFFNGNIEITPYGVFILIFYLVIYVVFLIESQALQEDELVKKDEWRTIIATQLPAYGIIFTIYTLLQSKKIIDKLLTSFIQIENIFALIFLFIVQVCVPLFILLYYNLNLFDKQENPNYDQSEITMLIFTVALYLHGLLLNQIYNWIKSLFSPWITITFAGAWCFLLPYFILSQGLIYILTLKTFSFQDIFAQILSLLTVPFIILIVFSWVLIEVRLFEMPVDVIKAAIERIKNKLINSTMVKSTQRYNPNNKSLFQKYTQTIIGLLIGGFYITIEILLLLKLIDQLTSTTIDIKAINVVAFELVGVPLFLIFGICISASTRQQADTYLWFPILIGAGPSLAFIIIYSYFASTLDEYAAQFQSIIIYAPVVVSILWLTIALFGVESRKIYLYLIGFMCLFFAIPIGVVYPLVQGGIDLGIIELIASLLVITGLGIIIAYLLVYLFRSIWHSINLKIRTDEFIDYGEIAYYNLQDYAFWLNSICFIISFYAIAYFVWNQPDTATDDEQGTIIALLIIHPVLFILINLASRYPSLEKIEDQDDDQTNPIEVMIKEQRAVQAKRKDSLQTYQKVLVQGGVIIPFFILLPIGLLQSNRILRTIFVGLSIGIPLTFLMFKVLLMIKNASATYQNFFQPFVISLFWCFIIFPFGVMVPVVSIYYNNITGEFQQFAKITLAFGLSVCVCGVTGTSIFFQILINKEEYERKRRFVLTKVILTLWENYVDCDLQSTNLIYEKYIKLKDNKTLKNVLLVGDPVNVVPYSEADFAFAKTLVTKQAYSQFMEIQGQKEATRLIKARQVEVKKQNKCITCLLDFIFCRCGLETMAQLKKQEEHEILTLQQLIFAEEQNSKTTDLVRITDLLPGLRVGLSIQEQMMDITMISIAGRLGMDAEERVLNNKQLSKFKALESMVSSRTDELKSIIDRTLDPQSKKRILMMDHAQSLKQNKKMMPEFLHEVFMQFSNKDEGLKPNIIFGDLKEMFRLGNLISRDGKKVNKDLVELGDGINDDQEEEEEEKRIENDDDDEAGIVTEDELKEMYRTCASQNWLYSQKSLSEKDFAYLLLLVVKSLISDQEYNLYDILHEFVMEYLYPNLLHNVYQLMLNLKSTNRKLLAGMKKFNYEESPFNQANILELESQQQSRSKKIQDEKNRLQKMQLLSNNQVVPIGNSDEQGQPQKHISKIRANQIKQDEFERQKLEIQERIKQSQPCHKRCFYSCTKCLRNFFWVWPSQCCNYINVKLFGSFKRNDDQLVKKLKENKTKQKAEIFKIKPQMPEWTLVVEDVVDRLQASCDEYDQQRKAEEYRFEVNSSNILAVYGRITELYALASIAFDPRVGWFGDSQSFTPSDVVDGAAFYDSFMGFFIASLSMAVIYGFLGLSAAEHSRNNTLGLDEGGNRATFPHPQFFLTKAVNFLGASQFMFVMKNFIDCFICNYDSIPYKLQRDSSFECLGDQHFVLMGLSLIGVGIYYPLSTFLFPDFQYGDQSLDLKYKSSFLVLYVQCKLLVMGISTIFQTLGEDSVVFQMMFNFLIMFVLVVVYIKLWPCYVRWFNYFELLLLVIILGLYGGAGVILITKNALLGWIIAGSVMGIALIGLFYLIYYIKTKNLVEIGQKKQAMDVSNINVILPTKRKNDVEVEEIIDDGSGKQGEQQEKKIVIYQKSPSEQIDQIQFLDQEQVRDQTVIEEPSKIVIEEDQARIGVKKINFGSSKHRV